MSALAKLWRWLQDRRRPAQAGTEAEAAPGAAQLQQSEDVDQEGCAERDLRAARRELLQQENWRHRAGPWQQK